jgi:hypothetical protein
MKKQFKVIIGIVVVIAILIAGVSLFYPAVFKGLTSGTFGKADKYHQQQMTEKDILLRSDLVADTGQLRSMIQGLIYFAIFTQQLSVNIDSCVNNYRSKGICSDPVKCASVSALADYSDFIRNNNKTLAITTRMLTAFYLRDSSDQSADVEKSLRDFGNYVNNLNEKDSVLNQALVSMDNFMLTDKTLKTKSSEIASLKSIRDQLLLQGVQLAGMLQDKPLCSQLLSYALSSQSALNIVIFGKEQLNLSGQSGLKLISSQGKLDSFLGSKEIGFGSTVQLGNMIQAQPDLQLRNSNQDLGSSIAGYAIIYDKANLQFIVGKGAELQKVLSASQLSSLLQGSAIQGSLCGVAVFSSQGANLYQSNFDLNNCYSSQMKDLGATLSSAQLNQVIGNQQTIGMTIYSSSFINIMDKLGYMGFGGISAQER